MSQSTILDGVEPGLTTTQAPFIEAARNQGQLYIHQPYELYSEENHESWRRLFQRILPRFSRVMTSDAALALLGPRTA